MPVGVHSTGRNNRKRPDRWSMKAKGGMRHDLCTNLKIERRFQVLRKTKRVIDLGCAPGSWSQLYESSECQTRWD